MQCIISFSRTLFLLTFAAFSLQAEPVAPLSNAPGKELGMWVWTREEVVDAPARAQLIAFSQEAGINRLFVQVRFTEQDGVYTLADADGMQALLKEAKVAGLAIEALDGAKDMAFAENRAVTLKKLDAVLAFHCRQPAGGGFSGVHYDIEPYLSQRWKTGDEAGVMRETLETFAAMRDLVKAADPHLTLSHDIPAWYDQKPATLTIEFNGVTKNFHEHIQDLSDYVGIMSYRRKATGANSVTAIISAELAYAHKTGKRVFPALETVQLKDEPSITFYNQDPAELRNTLSEVQTALCDDPAFGGVLIHQYRSLRTLLEQKASSPVAKP